MACIGDQMQLPRAAVDPSVAFARLQASLFERLTETQYEAVRHAAMRDLAGERGVAPGRYPLPASVGGALRGARVSAHKSSLVTDRHRFDRGLWDRGAGTHDSGRLLSATGSASNVDCQRGGGSWGRSSTPSLQRSQLKRDALL